MTAHDLTVRYRMGQDKNDMAGRDLTGHEIVDNLASVTTLVEDRTALDKTGWDRSGHDNT